jgi:serine/threonine protein kinase
MLRSSLPAGSKTQIIGWDYNMQPAAPGSSTCPTCGGPLEKTPDGGVGCMSCLLRAGIGSEEEVAQDSTPDAFQGGVRFGVYEIDCHPDGSLYELGRGAMGVTYRATDTSLQRKVALKIIKIDIAERSADARERFMREARAAAALRHENIATIHQFGMRLETGQYFYAMELIEGETLEERVRRAGPLDARTTIQIAEQITSGLAAAEKHGLVHRDLKPANLMLVSTDGETSSNQKLLVKIIDFGLAKAIDTQTDPKSLTHDKFVGTPAFASPEQFEHSALDVRSDIYSLGETLWFALTGKTPFAGRSAEEIHRAQRSKTLPVEQLKGAHVPSRLRFLLESMLALEPASRPGTHQLTARLQRCSPDARHIQRTRLALAASLVTLAAAAGWIVWKSEFLRHPIPEKSIAVLPFENLSDDKQNTYFPDAVQDQILTNLAKVSDLKVISHTSAAQYKPGIQRNLREIGKQLGVAYILEGSVQRSRDRLRINAQLIDAARDMHIWAESYDRTAADSFAIQSELARSIVTQLKAELSPKQKAEIEERPTEDLVAFELYLQAKQIIDGYLIAVDVRAALLNALQLLEQAIKRDANFVSAYCYAARANDLLYFFDLDPTADRILFGDAAVKAALRLRPDSAEAHFAKADFLFRCHRDYDGALKELAIARPGLPNDTAFLILSGYINRRRNNWAQAERDFSDAVTLDPRNPNAYNLLVDTYNLQRRHLLAAQVYDRVLAAGERTSIVFFRKASAIFDRTANSTELRDVLAKNPDMDVGGGQTPYRVMFALIDGNLAEAERVVADSPREDFQDIDYSFYYPKAWFEAMIARAKGDSGRATAAFSSARAILERRLVIKPKHARTIAVLAQIDAGLGRKELAIHEAQHAVDLMPVSKDIYDGALVLEGLAQVYTWTNEPDRAIELLEKLVTMPGYINYARLKLHPMWNPLRGDPRFEEIVNSLAPKDQSK